MRQSRRRFIGRFTWKLTFTDTMRRWITNGHVNRKGTFRAMDNCGNVQWHSGIPTVFRIYQKGIDPGIQIGNGYLMIEIWEKENGFYLGTYSLEFIAQHPKIKGGLLYGFLIAITTEGIVTI
jgi:hypothetical protein